MSVTVRLPSQLRVLVGGSAEVVVEATNVREAIAAVEVLHPGLATRVLDDAGEIRRFVNVFVADEDVIVGPKGLRLTKSKLLLGYILAQYIDGDDEEPTRTECVDLYTENALDKFKAYIFKQQQILHYICLDNSLKAYF